MQDFLDFWTFLRDISSNVVLKTFLNCIRVLANLVVLSYKPLSYKKTAIWRGRILQLAALLRNSSKGKLKTK